MLVGIDGNEANAGWKVGIGRYALELIRNIYLLNSLRSEDHKVSFNIYLKNKPDGALPEEKDWWRYIVAKPEQFWTQLALPLNLWMGRSKPDIFFTPSHYAPRFSACRTAVSIMDLSYLRYPQMFNKKDLWQLSNWTAYSVRKASLIFTISEFSKREIIKYYQTNAKQIIVTYPGFDADKFYSKKSMIKNKLLQKYGLNAPYLLFVGTLQPRKNIVRLLEAFKIVIAKYRDRELKLVIVGKKGWLYEEIYQKVKMLKIEERVVFTDYVADEDLPDWYRGAKCLILPSLYEGFGLPVLEGMACGCPVIVSNASSLPEVSGIAGINIDPYNVNNMAQGIRKILTMNQSQYQKQKDFCLKQAQKFSWSNCASVTLSNLENL